MDLSSSIDIGNIFDTDVGNNLPNKIYNDNQRKNVQLIDKYKPSRFDDIILNNIIKKKIQNILTKKQELTNMIFVGNTGTGKTLTISFIIKILFNNDSANILDISASDIRGIKMLENMENHCKKKSDEFTDIKLIILDDADNITIKAQHMISNLMDTYMKTVRFIFVCNKSSKIIESLQSRCLIMFFEDIKKEKMIERLQYICTKENIESNQMIFDYISNISNGDLRKAINFLQLNIYNSNILSHILKQCDYVNDIKKVLLFCKNKKIDDAIINIYKLIHRGNSIFDISYSLLDVVKNDTIFNEKEKLIFYDKISMLLFNVNKGLSTEIQLIGCISNLCNDVSVL